MPGMDAEGILNYLVYKARTMLREDSDIDAQIPYEEWDLMDYCKEASFCVYDYAKALGLDARIKILEP